MSVIEDVWKVVQDLVAPELKSLAVKLDGIELEVKLRGENVETKIETIAKTLTSKIESFERESKLRDENLANDARFRGELRQVKLDALSARFDSVTTKLDGATAKMDFQFASIMNALDLNRRVETLERDKRSASA